MNSPRPAILLLEDEVTLRRSMTRGLGKIPDIDVLEAGTLAEARAHLETHSPCLVLSDFDLPDGTGLEIIAALQERGVVVPVVFISAYVSKFRSRLPSTGDFEVYEKPVSLDRLRDLVERKLSEPRPDSGAPAPAPFGVADYLQLASMGRHSVTIEVTSVAGIGRIVVKGGQIWSATDEKGGGLGAFRRLAFLSAPSLRVRGLSGHEGDGPREIEGSAEEVLLDAARQHDEGAEAPSDVTFEETPNLYDTVRPVPDFEGAGTANRDSATRPRDLTVSPPRSSRRPAAWAPRTPSALGESFEDTRPSLDKGADGFARPALSGSATTGAPSATVPATGRPSDVRLLFDDLYDRGVDALLRKDYRAAYTYFASANELDANDGRVKANLKRLSALGFA